MSGAEGERVLPPFVEAPPRLRPVLPTVEVPYTKQKVFDFEESEEVPILTILSKMGNAVFKAKNSYFTLPIARIYDGMDDRSQVRYKCNLKIEGAPFENQMDMTKPYYYIQGNGNFIVSLASLELGLHEHKILELVETAERLENVASARNVQATPGVNRHGQDVNITSGDHCQGGTQQAVFELRGVILVEEAPAAVGDKRKRGELDKDVTSAATIIRGMSAGRKRTWKRKAGRKGRKTRKSRK